MNSEMPEITMLRETAREYGIPEDEVLREWERMQREYHLPFYVWPLLEPSWTDSTKVVLSPAVDVNSLSRLDRELPGWEDIPRPAWPNTHLRG